MVLELHAYADESGISRDEPYCMVGGFVASPRRWSRFKKGWREVLDSEGVPTFHAVEFFQQASWQSRSSPYYGWTPERAVPFLSRLLLTLRSRHIRDIGGLVDNAAFMALNEDDRRIASGGRMKIRWNFPGGSDLGAMQVEDPEVTGGAESRSYPAAFFVLVKQALEHVPDGSKVHFTFDLQRLEEGLARQNYAKMIREKMPGWEKLGGVTYDSSDTHEPLQAADLYVHTVASWMAHGGADNPQRFLDDHPMKFIAAYDLIGNRRRKLQVKTAASFERDEAATTEDIARRILVQFEEKQRRGR